MSWLRRLFDHGDSGVHAPTVIGVACLGLFGWVVVYLAIRSPHDLGSGAAAVAGGIVSLIGPLVAAGWLPKPPPPKE